MIVKGICSLEAIRGLTQTGYDVIDLEKNNKE